MDHLIAIVFVIEFVIVGGWHSTRNELTKKIDRVDPEVRSELIKLQGLADSRGGGLQKLNRVRASVFLADLENCA